MQGIAEFLRNVPSPLILFDARAFIAFANQPACDLFGYRSDELTGRAIEWLFPQASNAAQGKELRQSVECVRWQAEEARRELALEVVARDSDGSELPLEVHLEAYEEADAHYTLASLRSLAQPRAAERRMRHLERIAAMRSQISALTVQARDRERLVRGACRILVEVEAFTLAWIASPAPGGSGIRFEACFGEHALELQRMLAQEETLLAAEIQRVLERNRSLWIHDAQRDPLAAPLRELAMKLPAHLTEQAALNPAPVSESSFPAGSLVILPIQQNGDAVAALGLHSGEKPTFDEEERRLLEELAGNLSLTLDHIEQRQRLHRLASSDVLTGLPNRPCFLSHVSRALRSAGRRGRRAALAHFDLERFRHVNESLGRSGGDEILRQVAAWLIAETNDATLLARLGGDRFAVLIPALEPQDDVEIMVERWISRFQQHWFGRPENPLRLGVKAGIAMYPEDGTHPWTLFKYAEAALKQARLSRNRYLFHLGPTSEVSADNFVLENQLRRALDREEYVLYYQPKVDLRNGRLSGAEALIRWSDPERGLVPPNRFIPLLEETGLIIEVGRWTLGKVMQDVLRWRQMGLPEVRIAVNVSPAQLRHRQFFADIEWAVRTYPGAAAGLELEITEGMIVEDLEQSTRILSQIRAMGVTVALDDFGTGFASLRHLSRLPLDTLKVDRSFVVDLIETPFRKSQIHAIVHLAHAKRLNVVAEGVEREEQLELLRELGCDEMQGFLISKPVPGEVFETRYLSGDPLWPLSPLDHETAVLPNSLKDPLPATRVKSLSGAKPYADAIG